MADDGYQGDRADYFRQMDHRTCSCGHPSLSHGWGDAFGNGACGQCDCRQLSIHKETS